MRVTEECCVCGAAVALEQLDSSHKEAPTMWRVLAPGAWSGVVGEPGTTDTKRIVACSDACVGELLAEQAPKDGFSQLLDRFLR